MGNTGMDGINTAQGDTPRLRGLRSTAAGMMIALQSDYKIKTKDDNIAGTDRPKLKTALSNLYDALQGTSKRFDMAKVREILQKKGISLDKLMSRIEDLSVLGDDLTGDNLIQAVLQAAGLSASEIADLEIGTAKAKPEKSGKPELADLPELAEDTPAPAEEAKDPTPPTVNENKPVPAPLVPAGYASRKIGQHSLLMWEDKDPNGNIDFAKGEQKTVKIYYNDPRQGWKEIKIEDVTGLTDQFAGLLDGNGNVSYGIHDNVIDDAGFKALEALIDFWVNQNKVYDSDASFFQVFNDRLANIYDVPKAAINNACSTVRGWFDGVNLHDEARVGKILEEKNGGGTVINNIILDYIRSHKEKPIIAPAEIADLVLRCYVARETGKYGLLGVSDKVETTIETPSWEHLTDAKMLAWFRNESVKNEEDGKSGGSGASEEKYRRALEKGTSDAEKVARKMKNGPAKDGPLQQLAGFALDESNHGKVEEKLDKAIALANEISSVSEKCKTLTRIAVECFVSRDSEATRKKALEILRTVREADKDYKPGTELLQELDKIPGLNINKALDITALIKLVEDELRTPLEIQKKKELVFSGGKIHLENAAAAIAELDKISGENKAYALLAKAEIQKAQADDLWEQGAGDDAKAPHQAAVAKYKETAETAQQAAKTFIALKGKSTDNPKNQIYYNERSIQAQSLIARMIEEKSKIWMPKSNSGVAPDPKKDYYRKAFAEIGKFILPGTTLVIQGEGGTKEWTSSQFKRVFLELKKDEGPKATVVAGKGKPARSAKHAPQAAPATPPAAKPKTPNAEKTPAAQSPTLTTEQPPAKPGAKKGKKVEDQSVSSFDGMNAKQIVD